MQEDVGFSSTSIRMAHIHGMSAFSESNTGNELKSCPVCHRTHRCSQATKHVTHQATQPVSNAVPRKEFLKLREALNLRVLQRKVYDQPIRREQNGNYYGHSHRNTTQKLQCLAPYNVFLVTRGPKKFAKLLYHI